jgi:hypothetical protein
MFLSYCAVTVLVIIWDFSFKDLPKLESGTIKATIKEAINFVKTGKLKGGRL